MPQFTPMPTSNQYAKSQAAPATPCPQLGGGTPRPPAALVANWRGWTAHRHLAAVLALRLRPDPGRGGDERRFLDWRDLYFVVLFGSGRW